MALPNTESPAAVSDGRSLPTLAVIILAFLIAILMRRVTHVLGLGTAISSSLPWLAGAATLAGIAAVGSWRPAWLGDRNRTPAWVLLRLVLAAFALTTMMGLSTRTTDSGCPPTYTGDVGNRGGALLYARLVGDTLVCTYEFRGGL